MDESIQERVALETEIIRKCLSRSELQCQFIEYRGRKVICRRYASLFFIVSEMNSFIGIRGRGMFTRVLTLGMPRLFIAC